MSLTVNLDTLTSGIRYSDKSRVLRDVSALLSQTNSLVPTNGQLVQNNGYAENLLQLHGTVPIYYKSVCYHIPIRIWILLDYPMRPPQCYVTPTKDMKIKERHKHVDQNGLVYLPYLHAWTNNSSLVDLLTFMASVFSEDPPVFRSTNIQTSTSSSSISSDSSKSSSSATNNNNNDNNLSAILAQSAQEAALKSSSLGVGVAQGYPQTAMNGNSNTNYNGNNNYSGTNNVNNNINRPNGSGSFNLSSSSSPSASAYSSSPSTSSSSSSSSPSASSYSSSPSSSVVLSPSDVKARRKDELVKTLTIKLQQILTEKNRQLAKQMDELFNLQQQTIHTQSTLDSHIENLKNETFKLQSTQMEIQRKVEELKIWISKNDNNNVNNINVDLLVSCSDTWSKQLMDAVTMDMAIDDALYTIDRSLADDRIDVSSWGKQVRLLARKQFYERAMAKKVIQEQINAGFPGVMSNSGGRARAGEISNGSGNSSSMNGMSNMMGNMSMSITAGGNSAGGMPSPSWR